MGLTRGRIKSVSNAVIRRGPPWAMSAIAGLLAGEGIGRGAQMKRNIRFRSVHYINEVNIVSCSDGYDEVMSRRNYSQFCGLAHALDVVGERWTLLIVRELGSGPKRYMQLADTLAGIGTSLLATRMRQLESDGIVQRRLALDQPSSTVLYELTDAGRELAEAVIPLAVWGARHQMDDADVDREAFRAEWALGFLAAGGDAVSTDADGVYEFHVDDSVACLRVRKGAYRSAPAPTRRPPTSSSGPPARSSQPSRDSAPPLPRRSPTARSPSRATRPPPHGSPPSSTNGSSAG